jgi:hypothetical protein
MEIGWQTIDNAMINQPKRNYLAKLFWCLLCGLGLGLAGAHSQLHAQSQPTDAAHTRAQSENTTAHENRCLSDFPFGGYANFFPLVINQGSAEAQPTGWTQDPALMKQIGSLLPLGDQLGDIGQYYSQVAPSLASTLHVQNGSASTGVFSLTLMSDTGTIVQSLGSCAVPAYHARSLQLSDGGMRMRDEEGQFLPLATVCTQSQPAGPLKFHGLYHAQIHTDAAHPLTMRVETHTDETQAGIHFHTAGSYQAIPQPVAGAIIPLPALLATRQPENWWDTELVVQNVADQPVQVRFRLCDANGRCFENNRATLQARERRSFLASHLLYADALGFLQTRAGWFSATLTASAQDNANPQVVVLANYFQQPVAADHRQPQAEQGSTCLLQATPPQPSQQISYTVTPSEHFLLRLYNPATAPSLVTARLLDSTGQSVITRTQILPAQGSASWSAPQLFGPVFSPTTTPLTLQVVAEQALTAFVWQAGVILEPQAAETASNVWYAPLLAAPTVEFRWDSDDPGTEAGEPAPGSDFGLAETSGSNHALRPLWARRLNWYTWSATAHRCNEPVSAEEPYSTYITMWWGLGACGSESDRSCINQPARLERLRNTIPSNCAGRPLFLANEPDLPAPQSFMSYHELGRQIYQMRSWPGELYSPVFASFAYDRPTYVTEPTPWCEAALRQGWCPGGENCQECIQDGVVDGEWDPHDISFQGLETYFGVNSRWALGERWPIETILEGMVLHFYTLDDAFASDTYWRAPFLQQYRDRADEAGWPIIVSEYGFVQWPDRDGVFIDVTRCTIAHRLDDLRRALQKHLGDSQPEHGFNPKKLFWFHTGCSYGIHRDRWLCLFDDPQTLTQPVGACWFEDGVRGSSTDTPCTHPCARILAPIVNP